MKAAKVQTIVCTSLPRLHVTDFFYYFSLEMLVLDKLTHLKLPQPLLLIPFDKSLKELVFHKSYVHRITEMKNQHILDIYGYPINYGYIKENATTAIMMNSSDVLFAICGGFTVSIHIRPDTLKNSTILSFVNVSSHPEMAISSNSSGAVTVR